MARSLSNELRKRMKARAKGASSGKWGRPTPTIESAAEQLQRNRQLAANAATAEKERLERAVARARDRRLSEDEERNAMLVRQHAASRSQSAPPAAPEAPRVRARPAQPTRWEALPVEAPRFVAEPTIADVVEYVPAEPPPTADVRQAVRRAFGMEVLCAPAAGRPIVSWRELSLPVASPELIQHWDAWVSPDHWMTIIESLLDGNTNHMRLVSNPGSYNLVLAPTLATPVCDPQRWPPQLRKGKWISGEAGACLPEMDFVLRVTRTDAFPHREGEKRIFRSMKYEAAMSEMAMTLEAASLGLGPPVLAALAWPWQEEGGSARGGRDRRPTSGKAGRWGLLLVLKQAPMDMSRYLDSVLSQNAPLPLAPATSPAVQEAAQRSAAQLVRLCAKASWSGYINFDMKMGNLLLRKADNHTFFFIDFDATYYRHVDPEFTGFKARLFTNLLLLCVHMRAFAKPAFSKPFLASLGGFMLQLWRQAKTSEDHFGAGADWLLDARISPDHESGEFNQHELACIESEPRRLARQLSMMCFEYLFSRNPDATPVCSRANRFVFWDTKPDFATGLHPRLVPQLLHFAFFYLDSLPDNVRAILFAPA